MEKIHSLLRATSELSSGPLILRFCSRKYSKIMIEVRILGSDRGRVDSGVLRFRVGGLIRAYCALMS